MLKGIKNINVCFLWLAGMIIFSHAVTPHHHHFNSVSDCNYQRNHKNGPTENNPLHCHYFNDLTINKTGNSTNKVSIIKIASDIDAIDVDCYQYIDDQLEIIISPTSDDALPFLVFLENSLARGSPIIA